MQGFPCTLGDPRRILVVLTAREGRTYTRPDAPRSPSPALFTDLYQLTMAQAYWQSGKIEPAIFSLFFRKYPPDRAYFVFAGLRDVLEYLESFRFAESDIGHLRRIDRFDEGFLNYLSKVRFTGDVRAMEEGALFFTDEPVIEVSGPVIEAQLAETYLINQVNLQTILVTKASRVMFAARGKTVVDFAARRTQGVDPSYKLARVGYIVGFEGTSNVGAAATYGIPHAGTMAHSFVTTFDDEAESFRAYARSFPDTSIFLVDTYDTIGGVRRAIDVAREMRDQGHRLRAIRLDSGDLADLARESRAMLDEAGLPEVEVFASGGLDEFELDALLSAGAPIDGFGVGTKVGVSADAPWTDCAYKLVEYDGHPIMKLSTDKETLPGPKQIYRVRDGEGFMVRDILATYDEPMQSEAEPLLREVMRDGRQTVPSPTLDELRVGFQRRFSELPERYKALRSPPRHPVEVSQRLGRLQDEVASQLRRRHLSGG